MTKIINKLINWIIISFVFLLPLFFLPITTSFYVINKQTLLFFVTAVLFILWLIKIVISQTLSFQRTTLDLPILLFALVHVIISLVPAIDKTIPIIAPMGMATIIALTFLYFILTNNLRASILHPILYAFIGSASILGFIAIYQYLGLGERLFSVPWLTSKLFTPAGSSFVLISLLLPGLGIAITLFLQKISQYSYKNLPLIFFSGAASVVIALGLVLTIYLLLPGKETSLINLSYQDSWVIAIETLKRHPLFGVGPDNFLSAFNRFRPITFNNNNFWNVRFGNATNFPFDLLTTGGLLGLGVYLLLFIKTIKLWLKAFQQKKDDFLPFLLGLGLMLLIPWLITATFALLTISFIFLALLAITTNQSQPLKLLLKSKTVPLTLLGIGFLIVGFSCYFWGRVYLADVYFRKSLDALAQNQGTQVYNYQIKAISLNPRSPVFRRLYSQTNFALANSLAGQENLSDQDRNNISQLIQQAIREAKVATVLNPVDAANWENLAQIYRSLINFAQGADQWTIVAYNQAIISDPVNPRIRLNLGGLFYSLQNYEAAVRQFQNAVDLKPDYTNGYYNLAVAYREQEKYQLAYEAMQIVLNLLPIDSPDYQKAKDEADELAKKLPSPEEVAPPGAEEREAVLTEPSPLPSPAIQPPIELPEEAGPEIPKEKAEETSPSPKSTP